MQLNEVIEENSIATISKRTRISVENIERLVNRDFSEMKRVKALGFISILEREFGTELVSLKSECLEHFSSCPDEEFDAQLVVTVPESGEHSRGQTSKLFMLLVLFGVGYGAWYFFVNKGDLQESNAAAKNTSLIGSIVNQAQAWLGSGSSLDANSTDASTEGIWAQNDIEKDSAESSGANNETATTPNSDRDTDEQNDSAAEAQIIKEVKQEQRESIAKETKIGDAEELTIESIVRQDALDSNTSTTAADDTPAIGNPEDILAVEVPSMANEVNTDEIVAITEATMPEEQANKQTTNQTEQKSVAEEKVIVLHPLKKVWVGYTNLSTMKRVAKVIEEDVKFDTSVSSWILVAGHGAVSFVIEGQAITPKKRDKNYFLVKNGKVKNISKAEFQKLNKSTVW